MKVGNTFSVSLPMVSAVSLVFGGQAADELAVVPLGGRHLFRGPLHPPGVVGFLLIKIVVLIVVVRLDRV